MSDEVMFKTSLAHKLEKIKNKQCLYNIIKIIREDCNNGYVSDYKYTYIFLNNISLSTQERIDNYIQSLL